MDNLQSLLYEKAFVEQKKFTEDLKRQSPDKIIERAYEFVIREDILMIFENQNLNDKDVKVLLKLEHPLSACYEKWLKTDCSHMAMLRDAVDDLARDLIRLNEKDKKKQNMER